MELGKEAGNISLPAEECQLRTSYFEEEFYCYLFIMCPLAIAGVILNLISLKVFKDRSFNAVTFKYIRLITLTDFFICLIIIPYCVTAYTQPFNKYDLYARHFYLAYIYIPGANFAINLSMLLNLLVTVERLISVGWPTLKYTLFKPSRYYLSVALVVAIAFASNIVNLFLFKIEFCKNNLQPRGILMQSWWVIYGYVKEVLTRIVPILLLILANIMLICIVRSSRKRMKESTSFGTNNNKNKLSVASGKNHQNRRSVFEKTTTCCCPCVGKKNSRDSIVLNPNETVELTNNNNNNNSRMSSTPVVTAPPQSATKKNRQESQLTVMTIVVAVLYCVTSIPMVFAFPGLVFSAEQTQTKMYKMYAVLVNILELVQCSFRFLIYFCFTTQFRHVLYKMFEYLNRVKRMSPDMTTIGGGGGGGHGNEPVAAPVLKAI
jgi:hypothetical protein